MQADLIERYIMTRLSACTDLFCVLYKHELIHPHVTLIRYVQGNHRLQRLLSKGSCTTQATKGFAALAASLKVQFTQGCCAAEQAHTTLQESAREETWQK